MRLYIYTIPKAGTYFLADFFSRIGFNNTGFHVARNFVLNTRKLDLGTNARLPEEARENQLFTITLQRMRDGDAAFGHFPLPLLGWTYPDFQHVCAYRHPRKTLMSEFVDFRFRREDVPWLTRSAVAGDAEAFCTYLERHGPAHMSIFAEMIGSSLLRNEPLFTRHSPGLYYMLNFDRLLEDPEEAARLATAFGASARDGRAAREATLQAETKTKTTGLDIDRAALWSPRAENLYRKLDAESYVRRARELGWDL